MKDEEINLGARRLAWNFSFDLSPILDSVPLQLGGIEVNLTTLYKSYEIRLSVRRKQLKKAYEILGGTAWFNVPVFMAYVHQIAFRKIGSR